MNHNLTVLLRMYQMLFTLRLSTTSTRSLIHYAIFNQTGPPWRVDCLAPLWEFERQVSFSRTQRYFIQFRNQIGSRQPCNCLLALLFTELHRHFDCLYYGHNSALCPVWTSNLQSYDYYSALYQTEPRRRLTLHNKMFLVSVWHIQALCNV